MYSIQVAEFDFTTVLILFYCKKVIKKIINRTITSRQGIAKKYLYFINSAKVKSFENLISS